MDVSLKESLIERMYFMLDTRISQLQSDINSTIESRDTATKSSAGDKHETGRALMQTEIDNLEKQMDNFVRLKNTLSQAAQEPSIGSIAFGSLVKTNCGAFFLSISLGKIEFEGGNVIAISPTAPLARHLIGKKCSETVKFLDRKYLINEIE